jgi:hypothetical protein
MESVACYFGREVYAPSEIAQPDRPIPQRSHQEWRGDLDEAAADQLLRSAAEG